MQPKSDAQLLRDYAQLRAESAFTELVHRHTDLVYSAALRQVESPDIAAEIAQNVFIGLARGAKDLSPRLATEASLAGWLCRSARNLCLNHRRDEFRRLTRERHAMEPTLAIPDAEPDWEKLRNVLDDAMSELSETDYDALVLRFFQNRDFRAIGAAIGVSDDTAQKRVARALEKLHELLQRRGIQTSAGALSVVIATNAVQAAPAGLVATISAATLTGTAVTTSAAVAATTKAIAMTTLQKTVITATIVVLAGAGIYEAHQASKLRDQVQTLQQQQAPLAEQIRQLQDERDAASGDFANLSNELTIAKQNGSEVLKLRGELAALRTQLTKTRNAPEQEVLKSAEDYLNRSERHLDNHNYEAQLDDLNKAIELNPQLVLAYVRRAWLFAENLPSERGGYAQALADYARALEIDPNNVGGRSGRAHAYERTGKYSEAISDLTFCIEHHSRNSMQEALFGACAARGDIYKEHLNDYGKAIADFTTALQIRPYDHVVRQWRGQCYSSIGEQEKAEQDFALLPKRQ